MHSSGLFSSTQLRRKRPGPSDSEWSYRERICETQFTAGYSDPKACGRPFDPPMECKVRRCHSSRFLSPKQRSCSNTLRRARAYWLATKVSTWEVVAGLSAALAVLAAIVGVYAAAQIRRLRKDVARLRERMRQLEP